MMDKYYGLMDDSMAFQIAMSTSSVLTTACTTINAFVVLHPWYKLAYFHHAKWPKSWIDNTVQMLHEEWQANYKPSTAVLPSVSTSMPAVFISTVPHL
jgi:hypothetical protein